MQQEAHLLHVDLVPKRFLTSQALLQAVLTETLVVCLMLAAQQLMGPGLTPTGRSSESRQRLDVGDS